MTIRYIRPDENWVFGTTPTASSEQVDYEATRASDLDPARSWWGTSGTEQLVFDLGSMKEVGAVVLIHTNAATGQSIIVSGDINGSMTGQRQISGWPVNKALILTSGQNAQNFVVSTTGNPTDFSIGEVVAGKVRDLPRSFLLGVQFSRVRQVISDTDEDYEHEFRTDLGTEQYTAAGRMVNDVTSGDLAVLIELWEATRGGTIPFVIFPDGVYTEPRLVRMNATFTYEGNEVKYVDVEFKERARGIVLV